jgi:hypothetical protein
MASLFNPSELYEVLAQAGMVPQWAQTRPLSSSEGTYSSSTNRIVAPKNNDPSSIDILSHELAHAVQSKLFFNAASKIASKITNKEDVSTEEKQFLETVNKMFGRSFGRIKDLQNQKKATEAGEMSLYETLLRLYKPQGADGKKTSYDNYRTSVDELQAHGIGRMSKGADPRAMSGLGTNRHLDPSFATEFAILLEQYKKLPKNTQQYPEEYNKMSQKARSEEDQGRNADYYKYKEITEDPFKPTIK